MTESRTILPSDEAEGLGVETEEATDVSAELARGVVGDDRGLWMQTYMGTKFYIQDPRPEEIHLYDIAHALALNCRYAGHCNQHYSVAEHSVHLLTEMEKRTTDEELLLKTLLHDASEAYLCDIPRPIKPYLSGYKELEEKLQNAIFDHFGLSHGIPQLIHDIDGAILRDETAVLFDATVENWGENWAGIGANIECWEWRDAQRTFITKAIILGVEDM